MSKVPSAPWRVIRERGYAPFIADRHGNVVARVNSRAAGADVSHDAAADLIAAAPDLLAALSTLDALILEWRKNGTPDLGAFCDAHDVASLAIRKATNGAQS